MISSLESCQALVLNADYRPLSYFPLSVWSWQDTIKAVCMNRVNILEEYDRVVRSPTMAFKLPSVISLKEYVPAERRPAFTRFNVFLRDLFACQYCSGRFAIHDLTFDHVIPKSRGGRTTWENVVTACSCCNLRKGSKLPREVKMFPRREPERPSTRQLHEHGRAFPPNFLHHTWRDYLYWDSELEA